MNNYDDFISQVGIVPDFPENIYGKLRFRIVVEKISLPVTAFLFLMFIGIIFFSVNSNKPNIDWDLDVEEVVFSQDNSYYALFDE